MANGNTKPKLELQVNVPTNIRLLQDKPATGESTYGKWWLYNVECEEIEYSFFAPEPVQQYIETNHLGRGAELQLTKTLTKNGKANVVDYRIELLTKAPAASVPSVPPSNGSPKPTNGNGSDHKIMRDCLIAAIELQKELGSVVDVNRVGLSLYIARSKNGNGY